MCAVVRHWITVQFIGMWPWTSYLHICASVATWYYLLLA